MIENGHSYLVNQILNIFNKGIGVIVFRLSGLVKLFGEVLGTLVYK